VNEPVACLITPTMNGPAKPPRLPRELTSAIPAALLSLAGALLLGALIALLFGYATRVRPTASSPV